MTKLLPRLRAGLDIFPSPVPERPGLLLRDPFRYTEEIIIKRQRNQVESLQFNVQNAQVRRDLALKVEMPRQEQHLKDTALACGAS